MFNRPRTSDCIAVFGAAGHTGRFVVAELLRLGIRPIAIARDLQALAAEEFPWSKTIRRQASVDDAGTLDRALVGAHAVINCAGPFLVTADPVVGSAIRAGIHYLDVSAEQRTTLEILEKYDSSARQKGIVVLPAMGFYGGFGDLLVTAAQDGWDQADAIEIMIGLDSWHPTRGTRITGEKNTAPRLVVSEGRLVPLRLPPVEKRWDFGHPLGSQSLVELPFSEIILIAQHVRTRELHTYLSRVALGDVRDPRTPAPGAADASGRSAQLFTVEVVTRRATAVRRVIARGRDIYAFSAPLVCQAALHLLEGKFTRAGALPPGAVFEPNDILSALSSETLTLEVREA